MKQALLLLTIFIFALKGYAQTFTEVTNVPFSYPCSSFFDTPDLGWIVDRGGDIYKTTDGAAGFTTIQDLNTNNFDLRSIHASGSVTWSVETDDLMYKSTNAPTRAIITCPESEYYSNVISSGIYQTSATIGTNGVVSNNFDVTLLSGCINMDPGFETQLGAEFLADPIPCTSTQIVCGLGDIAGSGSSSPRYSIESHNGVVYTTGVSGLFKNIMTNQWDHIHSLSGPQVMESIGSNLYIGFTGGVTNYNDQNNSLNGVGQSLNGDVKAITVYNGDLVVGGSMTSDANGVPVELVAHLDGTTWKTLGAGFNTVQPGFPLEVNDMIVYNGSLIATGRFKFAGTTEVNGIAQWDGTSWQPFGTGLFSVTQPGGYGFGRSLAIYDGKLVVAGFFTAVDGVPIVGNIAVYDGTEWNSLGNLPNNNNITSLEVLNGVLYAAGIEVLTDTGETPLAAWDGTEWQTVVEFSLPGPIIWGLAGNETSNELYLCGNILEIFDESTNSFQIYGNVASLVCGDPIN